MQKLGFKTEKNKFQLHEALLAHRQQALPGGWRLTVESEPYFKKERPTALELRKGLYAPWFEVECEDGRLHLGFHESWPVRWAFWAAAALALAGMLAARTLLAGGAASALGWGLGALALALLAWDFTRAQRAQAAVSRFVRDQVLGESGQ